MKKLGWHWEMIQNLSDEGLTYRIYKELLKLNKKKIEQISKTKQNIWKKQGKYTNA
jgi:hypothetical protein